MLQLTIVFLLIILTDSLLGLTGVAAAAAEITAVLVYIFSILLSISLIAALRLELKYRLEVMQCETP